MLQFNGADINQMKLRWLGIVVLTVAAGCAAAGSFEFASPAVAGAPGTQTAPFLFVGFRGDGATTDTQLELLFDTSRFTAQLTPRNGAICLFSVDRIRIASPGSGGPLSGALVRYCEIRFAISASTAGGSYNLAPDLSTIECTGLMGPVPVCTAPTGVGVIRVGPNTPQAQFTYAPAAGGTVLLANGSGEISANFVAGGFGAAIELHDCLLTPQPGASFGPVLAVPVPLAFVSNFSGTGLVGLSCSRQSTDTSAQLACTETRNGTLDQQRSWSLLCPALPPELIFANEFESP